MTVLAPRKVEFQFSDLNEVNAFLMQVMAGQEFSETYIGEGTETQRVNEADHLKLTSSNHTFRATAESTSLQTLQATEPHARNNDGTVINPNKER